MKKNGKKTNNNNLIMFRLDIESIEKIKVLENTTKQSKNNIAKDIIIRYLRGL